MTIERTDDQRAATGEAQPRKGWLGAAIAVAFDVLLFAAKALFHVHAFHGLYRLCQHFGFCS